jgi:hypothetical protein
VRPLPEDVGSASASRVYAGPFTFGVWTDVKRIIIQAEGIKTVTTLLDCFDVYNRRIFPLQAVMAVAAIALMVLLFLLPGMTPTILIRAFLGLTFGWVAVACLFLVGDMRSKFPFAAFATAAGYIPLAVIFIADIFSAPAAYQIPGAGWRLYASVFVMVWGILLYPLTGYAIGHRYPRLPLFGAMPCPTNIFAIGFLTAFASNQLEAIALFILSWMAVIGAVKAAFLGYSGERIREDIAMLVSGLYGFIIGLAMI